MIAIQILKYYPQSICALISMLVLISTFLPALIYSQEVEQGIHQEYSVMLSMSDSNVIGDFEAHQTDSLMLNGNYAFYPADFYSPFVRNFFKDYKKGKITCYRDSKLEVQWKYKDFIKEAFFLEYFLSKKYLKGKKAKNADVLPEYRLDLIANESWKIHSRVEGKPMISRDLRSIGFLIRDFRKENSKPYLIYFNFNSKNINWDALEVYRDIRGYADILPPEIIASKNYNFKLINSQPALQDWKQHINIPLGIENSKQVVKSPYRLIIPNMPTPSNTPPFLNTQDMRNWSGNTIIFQQVLPLLWRRILQGKIPAYRIIPPMNMKQKIRKPLPYETLDVKTIYPKIEKHQNNPQPITTQSLEQVDFSYGIMDVEVSGRLEKSNNTSKVTFIPESIGFVWGDNIGEENKAILLRVKMSDVERDCKDLKILNQSITEYFSNQKYAYYVARLGSCYFSSQTESYVCDQLLQKGDWNVLYNQLELMKMTESQLLELIK